MKKFLFLLMMILWPVVAMAEGEMPDAGYTWQYIGTIAGATAATQLIVQYTKVPLDKVWKLPTRLYVYIIALLLMMLAQGFTSGITLESAALVFVNAVVVAMAAYGSYELTFAKRDEEKVNPFDLE